MKASITQLEKKVLTQKRMMENKKIKENDAKRIVEETYNVRTVT